MAIYGFDDAKNKKSVFEWTLGSDADEYLSHIFTEGTANNTSTTIGGVPLLKYIRENTIVRLKNEFALFLGDVDLNPAVDPDGGNTWGTYVKGMCKFAKSYTLFSNSGCFGASDTANRWASKLETATGFTKSDVSRIIIGGGYYDANQTNDAIYSGIAAAASIINRQYPRAQVDVFYTGNALDDKKSKPAGQEALAADRMRVKRVYYEACTNAGWSFRDISNMLAASPAYFRTDYHTPTPAGSIRLAYAISNALKGGDCVATLVPPTNYISNGALVYESGIGSGGTGVMYDMNTDTTTIRRNPAGDWSFTTAGKNLTTGTRLKIGTSTKLNFNVPVAIATTLLLHNYDSKGWQHVPGRIIFDGDGVYIATADYPASGSGTSVTHTAASTSSIMIDMFELTCPTDYIN